MNIVRSFSLKFCTYFEKLVYSSIKKGFAPVTNQPHHPIKTTENEQTVQLLHGLCFSDMRYLHTGTRYMIHRRHNEHACKSPG